MRRARFWTSDPAPAPGVAPQSPAMPRPALSLIAAVARNGAIGRENRLLIHLPGDLPRFKRLTDGAALVMGRKTWDSIGRPLPGRRSIVVSRRADWHAAGAEAVASLDAAWQRLADTPRAFVVGGGEVYAQTLPLADTLLLTEIDADLPGDTFFPAWDRTRFERVASEPQAGADGIRFAFNTYARRDAPGG